MTRRIEDIIAGAARALAENDRLRKELRNSDAEVAALCREYGDAIRLWGVAPHHLRTAVEARTGKLAA
jgi:hypothetical protein